MLVVGLVCVRREEGGGTGSFSITIEKSFPRDWPVRGSTLVRVTYDPPCSRKPTPLCNPKYLHPAKLN